MYLLHYLGIMQNKKNIFSLEGPSMFEVRKYFNFLFLRLYHEYIISPPFLPVKTLIYNSFSSFTVMTFFIDCCYVHICMYMYIPTYNCLSLHNVTHMYIIR